MAPALYGIAARHIEAGTPAEVLRFNRVADLADLPGLLAEYAAAYGARTDVLIELDTTPLA